jgi:thiamine-phosphate pyrophosphorylase
MQEEYLQIIDANICRVSEGLRIIEEYLRFTTQQKSLMDQFAKIRKEVNLSEKNYSQQILSRKSDLRFAEPAPSRKDRDTILKANFKRVEEGLRVLEEYTGNSFYSKKRYEVYLLEKEVLSFVLKKNLKPGIYLISDDLKILEQGLLWKVSCIQLRDKVSSKEAVLKKALSIQKKARKALVPLIINDYVDIALLCDADGFHSGQDDLDIASIRKLLGPDKIIGRSTQTLQQGLKAQKDGADYVGVGPIFSTPTKPDRSAIGFDYLEQAKSQLTIPYVAIGGINVETMEQIEKFSPPLVAVVRGYQDIPKIMKKYKKIFYQEV